MRVRFELNDDDDIAVTEWSMFSGHVTKSIRNLQLRSSAWFALLGLGLLGWVGWAVYRYGVAHVGSSRVELWALITGALFLVMALWRLTPSYSQTLRARLKRRLLRVGLVRSSRGVRTAEIQGDHLWHHSPECVYEQYPCDIKQIEDALRHIFVVLCNDSVIPIPKRAFASEADAAVFLRQLREMVDRDPTGEAPPIEVYDTAL